MRMGKKTHQPSLSDSSEIKVLIQEQLLEMGIQVKSSTKNEVLTLALGSTEVPPKLDCLTVIRRQLRGQSLSEIRAIQVRGYKKGVASPVWIERISTNALAISQEQNSQKHKLSSMKALLGTRNGERGMIVAGTFLLTSFLWIGIGTGRRSPKASFDVKPSSFSIIKPTAHTLTGSITLIDSELGGSTENCYGTGGYDDIREAMTVTVRDGAGEILAVGDADAGKAPEGEDYFVQCVFSFQVDEVPSSDFYSVEVGRRGELNYSLEEMEEQDWTVNLSLS